MFKENQGMFISPGFPGGYPKGMDCSWKIVVDKTKIIQLNIVSAILGGNCDDNAALEIIDEATEANKVNLCDYTENRVYFSTSNMLTITMKTGQKPIGWGFLMSYTAIDNFKCGAVLTSSSDYIEYVSTEKLSQCIWVIKNDFEETVNLKFTDVMMKNYGGEQSSIQIEVYDGFTTSNFDSIVEDKDMEEFEVTAKEIIIKSLIGASFKLRYETKCGGNIDLDEETYISSPGHTKLSKRKRNCLWRIDAQQSSYLMIQFTYLQLQSHDACHHEYVSIYNGVGSDKRLIKKVCGDGIPLPIFVSSPQMSVLFSADGTGNYGGFEAMIKKTLPGCGGVFTGTSGIFSSPSNFNGYPDEFSCSYMIASERTGYYIQLQFTSFLMKNKNNSDVCENEYVTFHDGSLETDPVLSYQNGHKGRFCGEDLPPIVISSGSRLLVVHHQMTDTNAEETFFVAQWKLIKETGDCDRTFASDSGIIQSQNYGKSTSEEYECQYKIVSNFGHFIKLTFEEFDFPESENCEDGRLEVYNNNFEESNSPDSIFCGSNIPENITSIGNGIRLVYKSKAGTFKTEFKLKYIAGSNVCGGVFYETELFGSIQSPNFNFGFYKPNLDCQWTINAKEDSYIAMSLADYDIQETVGCSSDALQFYDGNSMSSNLIKQYCGQITDAGAYLTTTQNKMLVRFKSDATIGGRGFLLYFAQACGGVYEKRSGVINSAKELRDCSYTIVSTSSDDVIHLTITSFDVGEMVTNDCVGDTVEILNTEDGTLTLCGNQWVGKTIKSMPGEILRFRYNRLSDGVYDGFKFNYEIKGCTNDYFGLSGEIMTPGYPDNQYINNLNCVWKIEVGEGKRVELSFSDIDLAADCDDDHVIVYNGDDVNDPLLGRYCMKRSKFTIQSSSNHVLIKFETSPYDGAKGFKLEYKEIPGGCGGTFKSHHGFFHSPGFPNAFEDGLISCEYIIEEEPNKLIELKFNQFDLGNGCSNYVTITDEMDPDGMKKYCGNNPPTDIEGTFIKYISKSNKIKVQFVAEKNDAENKGFNAEYNRACGGVIKVDTLDYLQSLHYPSYYDASDCYWALEAEPGQRINLKIVAMDIFCETDYLEIIDENSDDETYKKLCGSSVSAPIISKSNRLMVHFFAATHMERIGFKAEYSLLIDQCGYSLTWYEGEIASPGYPNPTQQAYSCVWHIKTFAGSKINVEVIDFEIGTGDCNSNYLEVFKGNDTLNDVVSRRCTDTDGVRSYTVDSNEMLIRFNVVNDNFEKKFLIKYTAECGETIISGTESGYLESLNYPNFYPNDISCYYLFQPPTGAAVTLTFEDFDLQESESCEYDLLFITEDSSLFNPAAILCGSNIPASFTSQSNYLLLFFQTDLSIRKRGYRIRYDYTVTACGDSLTASDYENNFTSINYPNEYDNNMDCSWEISTNEGSLIELEIHDMNFDHYFTPTFHFCFDSLTLFDYIGNEKIQIAQLCRDENVGKKFKSSSNRMIVEFKSDESDVQRGFKIGYKRGCGGLYTSTKGQLNPIIDEETGKYRPNDHCDWHIKVTPGAVIELQFDSDFNLEESSGCENDYVAIYDGPDDRTPLGKYCSKTNLTMVTSSSYEVYVVFVSNGENSGTGFKLNYEEKPAGCGGNQKITDATLVGTISSPKYPNPYPNSALCEWKLEVPEHYVVELEFDVFNLTSSGNCNTEYVEVRSEGNSASNLIGRYCGSNLPRSKIFKSTGHEMYIKFKSEKLSNGVFSGFHATWKIGCGGHYYSSEGTINSPMDGNVYPKDLNCLYQIEIPEHRQVHLIIDSLDLGETITDCTNSGDYLEILNADANKTVVIRLCGNSDNIQLPYQYTAPFKKMYMRFVSNSDDTRGSGFSLRYSTVGYECGGSITGSATFESPKYPDVYPVNKFCRWTLQAQPQELLVKITFLSMDIEDTENCTGDYLEIYNGINEDSRALAAKYCGSNLPPMFISTSAFVTVDFYSNGNFERGNGFKAGFVSFSGVSICGPSLIQGNQSGIIQSPGYPERYPSLTFCIYHIVADPGKVVRLKIDDMDLEDFGCQYDYVEIFDGPSYTSRSIATLCGSRTNNDKTFFSTSRDMFLVFESDSIIEQTGFKMSWSQENISCRADEFNAESGVITSVNYPNVYPADSDCEWKIIAPQGYVIDVKINSLDIPESDNCENARLVITNGHAADAPEIRRLCGKVENEMVFVGQHLMKISFVTTGDNTIYKGFNITFKARGEGCGGFFHNEGDIISPNYPTGLSPNQNCEWVLTVPQDEVVVLKIFDLDIFGSTTCLLDSIELRNGNDANGEIIHKFCSNEYESVYESKGNQMFIRLATNFQSSFDPKRGFKFHFNSGCGGEVTGLTGTLKTINYPDPYPNNLMCTWSLELPKYHSIVLDQLHFHLPEKYDANGICNADRVDIMSSFINISYCGTIDLDDNLEVDINEMKTIFYSDNVTDVDANNQPYKGIRIRYSSKCGSNLNVGNGGTFKFPLEGSNMHAMDCVFIMEADDVDKRVRLQIKAFDVENGGTSCVFDYLEIRDGGDEKAPMVGRFCGDFKPPVFVSSTNKVYLKFHTDGSGFGDGFLIGYSDDPFLPCGETFRNVSTGEIKSQNYPGDYPPSSSCGWSIKVAEGKKVQLTFKELSIPHAIADNLCDSYILLYDSLYPDDRYRLTPLPICGTDLPLQPYYSLHNTLYVRFLASDNAPDKRSFKAEFQEVEQGCDKRFIVTKEAQTFDSLIPGLNPVVNETVCDFVFVAEDEKQVEITLHDVVMPVRVNGQCDQSYLIILDGMLAVISEIHPVCGNETVTFQSTHNVARLRYINYNENYSFKVTYREIEGCDKKIENAEGGLITSPNHPLNYQKHSDCNYHVTAADKDAKITLFVEAFNIEQFPDCVYDYLTIHDGADENAPILGDKKKYCGHEIGVTVPEYMQTTGNSLYMRFVTDYSVTHDGFAFTYVVSTEKCGGNVYGYKGALTSPNFPSFYEPNLSCSWMIDPGNDIKKITITFMQFEVENAAGFPNCDDGDYLTFTDSTGDHKFCGASLGKHDYTTPLNVTFVTDGGENKKYRGFHFTYKESEN